MSLLDIFTKAYADPPKLNSPLLKAVYNASCIYLKSANRSIQVKIRLPCLEENESHLSSAFSIHLTLLKKLHISHTCPCYEI